MQLSNDRKNRKKYPKLLIPADKTNNLYEITTEYNKLLLENISKIFRTIRNRDCKQTLTIR